MDFYDEVEAPRNSEETFKMLPQVDPRFAVYPVPSKQSLTVASGIDGVTYYKIVSLEGRLVNQGNFSMRSELNIATLSAGTYYLEMTDATGNIHYRTLIAKE
jgi:hypothetical protein